MSTFSDTACTVGTYDNTLTIFTAFTTCFVFFVLLGDATVEDLIGLTLFKYLQERRPNMEFVSCMSSRACIFSIQWNLSITNL